MKSSTITMYKEWLQTATNDEVNFVDAVYHLCEENYENGADTVVECFDPPEILKTFQNLDDVKEFCGIQVERSLNARWGEDSDPQVETARRYDNDWKDTQSKTTNPRPITDPDEIQAFWDQVKEKE